MVDYSKIHKNIRKDEVGYVYWKDIQVEHYDFLNDADEELAARILVNRCVYLERMGITPTGSNTIWHWDHYAPDAEYKRQLGINVNISLDVPLDLAKKVTSMCQEFNIRGVCDPQYICNMLRSGGKVWHVYPSIPKEDYPRLEEMFAQYVTIPFKWNPKVP